MKPGPHDNRRGKGAVYEDLAADFLLAKGYTLLTRRYKARSGELDIVAMDGDEIVIVEVKYLQHGRPEDQVDDAKVRHIKACANEYLSATDSHGRKCRFDIVAVTDEETRHWVGAF